MWVIITIAYAALMVGFLVYHRSRIKKYRADADRYYHWFYEEANTVLRLRKKLDEWEDRWDDAYLRLLGHE